VSDARSDALLAGLTPRQRDAVELDDAPLCVLAGAGSGKTTVLTRRVARRVLDGSADAEHVLVATFTRKAAGELRARMRRLDVPGRIWAGTFHAAAFAQLRRHRADRGLRPLSLLDDPARLVRHALVGRGVLARDAVAAVVGEVQWAQSRLVGPDDYVSAARAQHRRVPLPLGDIAECFSHYVEAKRTRSLVDLGDLLVDCARLVEEDAAAAAALRWRVRHLFVDEFQDVNPAQYRLLRGWLGDRDDLFVVGDPRQAVYGWNGADPTLLDRIGDVLPGTTVLSLDENHRSTPQVVAAARTVLGADTGARPGTGPRASGANPDGPEPVVAGFDDEEAEARALSRWLRLAQHPGRTWSHMAVLARTNRRLDAVADALAAIGIPHHRAAGPAPAGAHAGTVIRALRRLPAGAALRPALTDATEATGPDTDVPAVLRCLADEYAVEEPEPAVGGFLTWLAATVGTRWDEPEDQATGHAVAGSVTLSTFHRAKGLEWPMVALIGLEAGLVPIAYATSPAALEEERRLLYVAMTRAERELWCSWAASRALGGQRRPCDPSPYLAALGSARTAAMAADDVSARLARLRATLAAAG
jgi:DNA helicase II / ATP-dependent DNA helicase PcrA